MKQKLLPAAVAMLSCSISLAAEESFGWLGYELERIEDNSRLENPYHTQWFYLRDIFLDDPEGDAISERARRDLWTLLEAISVSGKSAWGAAGAWTFPESSQAPRLPVDPNLIPIMRPIASNCIPSFDSVDYREWSQVRNRMHGTLVREFPELEVWWIGLDPGLPFASCTQRGLSRSEFVRFALDSLEGIRNAAKTERPGIQVGFHFLGSASEPIRFLEDGNIAIVEPAELLEAFAAEARRRGYDFFTSFDLAAWDLEPDLLDPREDESSVPWAFGQTAMSSAGGWQVKFLEEFNTDTSDLVANYDHWKDIRTDTEFTLVTVVEIDSGIAMLRLEDPTEEQTSIAGAVTVTDAEDPQNGVDVVPDQEFQTSPGGDEWNKWTAVTDFSALPPGTDPPGAHAAAFLRVNDRTYVNSQLPCDQSCPDQMRFGV